MKDFAKLCTNSTQAAGRVPHPALCLAVDPSVEARHVAQKASPEQIAVNAGSSAVFPENLGIKSLVRALLQAFLKKRELSCVQLGAYSLTNEVGAYSIFK